MSHIVTIDTQVRDAEAVRAACRRLGLPEPVHRTVKLFADEVTGLVVAFPDWQYPVVCDLSSGEIRFDNFEGRWGDQRELDRLVQMYTVEKSRIEARKAGHSVTETPLTNGSIKLTINVGGAA